MDLKSDLPFWTVRNGLIQVFPPLQKDVTCDALVVGGGISGALIAARLVRKGVDCIVVDRRDIGFGSTSASTALLQYEIDTPLRKLQKLVDPASAERAYRAGLEAIRRLQRLSGSHCGFKLRPSLQVAATRADALPLRKEFETRQALGFPVSYLSETALRGYGVGGHGALRSEVAAEVDPYRLTHRLLRRASEQGLRVFDRTEALRYSHSRNRVTVETNRGRKIRCRSIFFATGYETQDILPDNLVRFKSTYALVSEPLVGIKWWKDRSLIWGTGDPYLYVRSTSDDRIIVGGEDDSVLDPKRRDSRIDQKTKALLRKAAKLLPNVRIEPAFAWAGVFGSTKDGLAYIGEHPAFPRAYFALGFGGNGITFAEIASRIVSDLFLGRKNGDTKVFRFDR